ncbi:MAG: oligopeptide transporter, OPT family [Oligoflexia bacterium]|nr:oligopeptide transporter, OPT family [Oligoflexia bacterium]
MVAFVTKGGLVASDVQHKSFVADTAKLPELTPFPLIMGVLLGIIFGASSLYLALKVGMTVSASIPIAVLSITIFRGLAKVLGTRKASILENNIVQTTGSAGESIAFGVAVTMPALLILGYDMELTRVALVAILGSLLGILMMIPLRYALIVKAHKELAYPEGTACAAVLISGEKGGTSALTVFTGFFFGFFYKLANVGMKLWTDVPEKIFSTYKGSYFSTEVSPELLGVGYIIGPRIAGIMIAGGILSAFVLTPAIVLFGGGLAAPIFPATKLISQMSVHEIWKSYVLYIGAGAVAAGGIISLFQSLPVIAKAFVSGLGNLRAAGVGTKSKKRTEQDLSMRFVVLGIIGLVFTITVAPQLNVQHPLGGLLVVFFGFLFVTVSSRLTGEIGSSSNPISGMTVATLLITCLIFVLMGWIGPEYRVTALSIAAVVCIAASNGGTTSQDLKTGYLVGGTPKLQQIGILVGSLTSALVIGYTILVLIDASTIYSKRSFPGVTFDVSKLGSADHKLHGPDSTRDSGSYYSMHLTEPTNGVEPGKYLLNEKGEIAYLVDPGINGALKARDDGTPVQKYDAPKARLMSLIIDGILTQKLPWGLVLLGVFIAVVLEFCGIASLPFAVGVYLPISSSAPIFFGGLIRWIVDRSSKKSSEDSDSSPGVLLSSGLIAGGAIAGIAVALGALNEGLMKKLDLSQSVGDLSSSPVFAYFIFAIMCAFVLAVGKEWLLKPSKR